MGTGARVSAGIVFGTTCLQDAYAEVLLRVLKHVYTGGCPHCLPRGAYDDLRAKLTASADFRAGSTRSRSRAQCSLDEKQATTIAIARNPLCIRSW